MYVRNFEWILDVGKINISSVKNSSSRNKHRKAWIVPACISKSQKSSIEEFSTNLGNYNMIRKSNLPGHLIFEETISDHILDVNCFPLASILYAMNE